MNLSSALYNAFSGLKANARAAGLVSTNIANSTTESYGRRTLDLSASGPGGGVWIDGVTRNVDPALIKDRQLSDAKLGYEDGLYSFNAGFEDAVGNSDSPGSLMSRLVGFENALLTAAANPASEQRLDSVASAADALADKFNTLSDELQDARLNADRNIGIQVDKLNTTLERLDEINNDVVRAYPINADVSSILDERQRLLDEISSIVPLRVIERDRGEIAIFSTEGAILLDGRPAEIDFESAHSIDAYITFGGGVLSGLTLNGTEVDASGDGMFAGGSLAANFEIRDETAVARQEELDGIARDLVERFDATGPDTTLGAADPGLFTDAGLAFDPLDETGLSGRISLNGLVEAGAGGTWRIRDGLGALTQGPVGDASLIQGITDALNDTSLPSSTALSAVSKSMITLISDYSSDVASSRVRAENEQTFVATQNTSLRELELTSGVDTDQELQNLMVIEQHYAANAKVMTTVDELMERLLAI